MPDTSDILREGFYLKSKRFQVIHIGTQANSVRAALPPQGAYMVSDSSNPALKLN